MKIKVTIAPYDPDWSAQFEKEKATLDQILHEFQPQVEHIGSTSVPGLGAKPIIDILVGLNNESDLDKVIEPMMQGHGYTYYQVYNSVMPYRRYFSKLHALTETPPPVEVTEENRGFDRSLFKSTVHIHIMVKDTFHWNRHIAFRDYLRVHESVRKEYEALKTNNSKQVFTHPNAYNEAKNDWVKATQAIALEWWQQ